MRYNHDDDILTITVLIAWVTCLKIKATKIHKGNMFQIQSHLFPYRGKAVFFVITSFVEGTGRSESLKYWDRHLKPRI
jgi:hypothetical protein